MRSESFGGKVIAALVVGTVSFAFAPIMVRAAGGVDPIALATIRTVSAALILFPFWCIMRLRSSEHAYDRHDNGYAALAGVFLGLHFICWIAAFTYTSVASASVLVTTHPVILILIEAGWLKRTFPGLVWAGVLIAFSGSALLGISDGLMEQEFEHALTGDLFALAAAVLFAFYFLISQKMRQKSGWLNYVFRVYGVTGITCLLVSFLAGVDFTAMPVEGWLAGAGLAIGPQIAGHGSMNLGVRFISPTVLSTLILSEPVFATILAYFIFAELPHPLSILAVTIVLAGISTTWWGRLRHG